MYNGAAIGKVQLATVPFLDPQTSFERGFLIKCSICASRWSPNTNQGQPYWPLIASQKSTQMKMEQVSKDQYGQENIQIGYIT